MTRPDLTQIAEFIMGDVQADRMVPPTGITARLTLLSAAAMAFLAVFALALSVATGRMADRWGDELARSSTLRISAPADQIDAQTQAALRVLEQTPGVASARALSDEEQRALLEPWFGPDLPVETLPIPQLIEVTETPDGYDAQGLRLRLSAEVPGAVLDDHTRWRRPLVDAASRLRLLGWVSILLIFGTMAAMITLAANAALAANAQVIAVLRLVGAGGFSYEEAASICDCAVGTVKSRVARARVALDEMIDNGLLPARSENSLAVGDTTEAIMSEMEKLVR